MSEIDHAAVLFHRGMTANLRGCLQEEHIEADVYNALRTVHQLDPDTARAVTDTVMRRMDTFMDRLADLIITSIRGIDTGRRHG